MTFKEKSFVIDNWLNFMRRTYAGKGHYQIEDNGIYESMVPIGDAKGVPELYNLRLEDMSDDDLHSAIQEIKSKSSEYHICPTGMLSARVEMAYYGRNLVHPNEDEIYGIMMPEDMPQYLETPKNLTIKEVNTDDDFTLWCELEPDAFWKFTCQHHYHLIKEEKMVCFLVYMNDQLVASSEFLNDNGAAAMQYCYVLPDYRRKGIATALCQHTMKHAFHIGAKFVVSFSFPAGAPGHHPLFMKLGFPIVAGSL